jgi:feruloyl-CoA synthase
MGTRLTAAAATRKQGTMYTISDIISNNARNFGRREALVAGDQRLSFIEFEQQVSHAAAALQSLGVGKGDRVALMGRNTVSWVVAAMGALRAGAVLVPINHKLMPPEVQFITQHCQAKVLLFDAALTGIVQQTQSAALKLMMAATAEHAAAAEGFPQLESLPAQQLPLRPVPLSAADQAEILYTSGTTGKPKGCLHTHENILLCGIASNLIYQLDQADKALIAMPVWHCFPLNNLLMGSFYVGATVVLMPEYHPLEFLKVIQAERCTLFFGAPIAYTMPLKMVPQFDEFDLSSVRIWLYGGGPIDAQTVRVLMQRYRTDRFFQVFGMTETGPTGLVLYPREQEAKAGSIGRQAVSGCVFKVMKEGAEEAGPGDIGEIWMRCQSMMQGYYLDPEATRAAFQDGWYLTGDLARIDADGYLFIIDRAKDMIITGGENVYSKEVEDVLMAFPGVTEVAVIGKPHPEWGETVVAVIALGGKPALLDEQALRDFCGSRIARYKVPREFQFVEALPRTPTGKVMKFKLR